MTDDLLHYTLKSPKTSNGIVLTSVSLREPTVDDMIAVEELGVGETAAVAHLLARMAGLPFETFLLISSRDARAMKRLADAKWGNEEQDGETSPS